MRHGINFRRRQRYVHYHNDRRSPRKAKAPAKDDFVGLLSLEPRLLMSSSPIAVDDTATTEVNTDVTIAVLANDSDPDGDVIRLLSFTHGSNGSVGLDFLGQAIYTPDGDFEGVDTFTYTITDGNGGEASATVTVTVGDPNQAPIAVDDSATTEMNMDVTIPVLANDSDPDGDFVRLLSFTHGSNGSVGLDFLGQAIYTPDAGFVGTDTFSYTIGDGNGGEATATVTVTVEPPVVETPAGEDVVFEAPTERRAAKLSLHRTGDLLEITDDRTGEVLFSADAATLNSLTIVAPADSRGWMRLTVDFSAGDIELAGGLHVHGSDQARDDLRLVGSDGEDDISVDGSTILANGLLIETSGVDMLHVFAGDGDDDIGLYSEVGYEYLKISDSGGDDHYTLATTGQAPGVAASARHWAGNIQLRDSGGDDRYDIHATGGAFDISNHRGDDTFSFADADHALSLNLNRFFNQDLGLGDMTLTLRSRIENIVGTEFDDVILGRHGLNRIDGGAGNDLIIGRNGHNILAGGAGNDMLLGGHGRDVLTGGAGNDLLAGGRGRNILIGGDGGDTLLGGRGQNVLVGGSFDGDLHTLAETWFGRGGHQQRASAVHDLLQGSIFDDHADLLLGRRRDVAA